MLWVGLASRVSPGRGSGRFRRFLALGGGCRFPVIFARLDKRILIRSRFMRASHGRSQGGKGSLRGVTFGVDIVGCLENRLMGETRSQGELLALVN